MREVAECIPGTFDNPYFLSAREHYDPDRHLTQPELGAFLLKHYQLDEGTVYSPILAGTIAADVLSAGLCTPGELRQAARHPAEQYWVEQGVAATISRTDQQARAILQQVPKQDSAGQQALAVADHIAWATHGTTWRKSGKNTYEHPAGVAAIALAGLEAVEHDGWKVAPQLKEQIIIDALLHDTVEDSVCLPHLDPRNRLSGVSPFLMQRTLQLTGVDYGVSVGTTLRHLTRVPGGFSPEAPIRAWTYKSYLLHGRENLGFCLTKAADIIHNSKHDPKPTPTPEAQTQWRSKLIDYGWALKALREQAVLQTARPDWPTWLPHYLSAVEATEPAELPAYLDRLEAALGQPLAIRNLDSTSYAAA